MNDRLLQHIHNGPGRQKDDIQRYDEFAISVDSKIMSVFCLDMGIHAFSNHKAK
ncbi:MAG: formate--tetrahydrofolate ligase [Eggerthellaceae bacterium]|nr:formate--tetrahydrofolate ligase [Eggerthellaceae bacterium]